MDVTKISYLRVIELQFKYNFPETGTPIDQDKHDIDLKYGITRYFNPEDKNFKIRLTVEGVLTLQNKEKANFALTTEHFFEAKEADELSAQNEEGEYLVEDILDQTLCGLAYSTTRGMLQQKLRDTIFNSFLLPVVKPSDLIN